VGRCGLGLFSCDLFEQGNELLGSIKGGEFID
jgi:hypothetical protein